MELENVEGFSDPDVDLEQYETPADLASHLLHLASQHDDLESVVDLGCGTGVLSIGSALQGASVVGVDVDRSAVEVARENAATLGVEDCVEFVVGDVRDIPFNERFSAAVMNPPFGAQEPGADRPFLDAAERLADVVYSVHNTGSLEFVESYVEGEMTHAFESEVALPRKFEFHDDEVREVEVEVYRIESTG